MKSDSMKRTEIVNPDTWDRCRGKPGMGSGIPCRRCRNRGAARP